MLPTQQHVYFMHTKEAKPLASSNQTLVLPILMRQFQPGSWDGRGRLCCERRTIESSGVLQMMP